MAQNSQSSISRVSCTAKEFPNRHAGERMQRHRRIGLSSTQRTEASRSDVRGASKMNAGYANIWCSRCDVDLSRQDRPIRLARGTDARDAHVGPGATERGAASTAYPIERHAVARARERLRSRVAVWRANRVGARGANSIANREIGGEARLGGQRVALVYGQCVSGAPRKERTRLPVQRAIARERSEGRERRATSSPTTPADAPLGCYAPRTA